MQKDLLKLRHQLSAAMSMIDTMLATSPSTNEETVDTTVYRVSPGGTLSEIGIAEIRKRFELGETDAVIARDMGISVQGVAKRRKVWKDGK